MSMKKCLPVSISFAARKGLRYVAVLLAIVSLNFAIPRLMPGDPVLNLLGEEAAYIGPELIQEAKKELGLEGSVYEQYVRYLRNILRGNWGVSFHYMRPVSEVVRFRLAWTLALLLPAIVLAWLWAVVLGALAGWKRGSRFDAWATSFSLFLHAMPQYWLAMLVVTVLSLRLGLFPLCGIPAKGESSSHYFLALLHHAFLPVAVLSISRGSYDFLIVRNSVVSVLGEDYVLVALAKGLSKRLVLFKHVLRNALAPVVTVTALQFGHMVSGALMTEIVFSWPGMGTLIYEAVRARDYPVLQATFLVVALCVLAANFLADLAYPRLEPRLRC